MAGITIPNATLAATFHCVLENVSRTDATLVMSTISYSSPTVVATRASTTDFWSRYHAPSGTVSVFTRTGEDRQRSRFVAPPFPVPIGARCTGFRDRNSLLGLLANTAAEVGYFNRGNLPDQPLRIKGRYVRGAPEQNTGRGTLIKLVLVDSRIRLLGSKRGEYIHLTNGDSRYTRVDKYERSDIASGTLIVYVTLTVPFPVQQTELVLHNQFEVPLVMARNIMTAHGSLDHNLPDYIIRLVRYIDLCINPIVDGLPALELYLDNLWEQDLRKIMDQVVIALDIYDQVLLSNVFNFVGLTLNGYLSENLSSIASRLEFTESPL